MTTEIEPLTQGIHHVGLTVKNLNQTNKFFVETLGYQKLGEKPDYPAIFISDGHVMITLWQAQEDAEISEFDRKHNIGLHHLSLKVNGEEGLDHVYQLLTKTKGVTIEFAPETLGGGPTKHMMITEPGGIRIEFIAPGK